MSSTKGAYFEESNHSASEVHDDSAAMDYGLGVLRSEGFDILTDINDVKNLRKAVDSLKQMYVEFKAKQKCSQSRPSSTALKEADPFAELDTTWGGDKDANEIAEELHAMRTDTRTIEAW